MKLGGLKKQATKGYAYDGSQDGYDDATHVASRRRELIVALDGAVSSQMAWGGEVQESESVLAQETNGGEGSFIRSHKKPLLITCQKV